MKIIGQFEFRPSFEIATYPTRMTSAISWAIWQGNEGTIFSFITSTEFNLLTPNDDYSGRTAPLTSKRCILYIYSTHTGTEYFKHGIYSPFFFSSKCSLFHNSNIFGSWIIHITYTECAKIKKIIPAPKG